MMRNPILTAILGLFLLFGFVPFGQADEAAEITKMAKEKVNNIITYLRDTSLEKETRNKQIIAEVNTMFDFQLMAQLSLGKQWKKTKNGNAKKSARSSVNRSRSPILKKLTSTTIRKWTWPLYTFPSPTEATLTSFAVSS